MYSDIFLKICASRGLTNIEQIIEVNTFKYSHHIHPPETIKGMIEAIEILHQSISKGERIAIYADYDCDGIPGATILSDFFDKINYKNYVVYIPHRHNEGYGIHIAAIDKLIACDVKLIITIDLGITNVKEIKYAKDKGIKVILTDHHLPIREKNNTTQPPPQILPPAHVVINMKRDDCEYPDKNLCGNATIWKLIVAFLNKYRNYYKVEDGWEKTLLDLVGLSTIADMVPLKGENRALAHFGLQVLKISKRAGLLRILNNAQYKGHIDEETIGFAIAPRLNSASRMDDPIIAYHALYDKKNGAMYADKLEILNDNRKQNVKDSMYDINQTHTKDNVILIHNPDWNPGVLGLIASKVVEETGHTTFVAGGRDDEGNYKGSVRAGQKIEGIPDINVVQMMSEASHLLLHFGGHEAAGGFKIHESKLEAFRGALNANSPLPPLSPSQEEGKTKNSKSSGGHLIIDSSSITQSLYNEIRILGPFGIGNASPKIAIKGKYKVNFFGKKKEHIELLYVGLRVIKFNFTTEDRNKADAGASAIITLAWDNYRSNIVGRLVEFMV